LQYCMYASCCIYISFTSCVEVHTQEVTPTSYAGARNNIQIRTNDNTKKGL
jgi:hypothetical protein